jgi:hypothetical protein
MKKGSVDHELSLGGHLFALSDLLKRRPAGGLLIWCGRSAARRRECPHMPSTGRSVLVYLCSALDVTGSRADRRFSLVPAVAGTRNADYGWILVALDLPAAVQRSPSYECNAAIYERRLGKTCFVSGSTISPAKRQDNSVPSFSH